MFPYENQRFTCALNISTFPHVKVTFSHLNKKSHTCKQKFYVKSREICFFTCQFSHVFTCQLKFDDSKIKKKCHEGCMRSAFFTCELEFPLVGTIVQNNKPNKYSILNYKITHTLHAAWRSVVRAWNTHWWWTQPSLRRLACYLALREAWPCTLCKASGWGGCTEWGGRAGAAAWGSSPRRWGRAGSRWFWPGGQTTSSQRCLQSRWWSGYLSERRALERETSVNMVRYEQLIKWRFWQPYF